MIVLQSTYPYTCIGYSDIGTKISKAKRILSSTNITITNIIGCNDISDIMMATKNQNMHNTLITIIIGYSDNFKIHVAIISKALFFLLSSRCLLFIVIHVHVHVHNIFGNAGTVNYAACSFVKNAMLAVFPCLSCVDRKKDKKSIVLHYSDASVIVIKSRKSKGYDSRYRLFFHRNIWDKG